MVPWRKRLFIAASRIASDADEWAMPDHSGLLTLALLCLNEWQYEAPFTGGIECVLYSLLNHGLWRSWRCLWR